MQNTVNRKTEWGTRSNAVLKIAGNIRQRLMIALLMLSVCLACGCGEIQTMIQEQESKSEVKVNSSIYSNDYVLDEGPREGGTLEIYSTAPETFNPLLVQNVYVREITGLIYESIVNIDSRLKAETCLADSWTVSEDRLSWEIELKTGLYWHDGEEFTARDVVKTIERIREYGTESPYYGIIGNIREVRQQAKHRVVLDLHKANSFTPETLIFPIVPAHLPLEGLDNVDVVSNIERGLVGTGPYMVERYTVGDRIRLTENTKWAVRFTERKGSPPYVGKIVFTFFDVKTSALSVFQKQGIQAFFSRNVEYARYQDSTEMQIKRYSERELSMLAFNTANPAVSRSVRFAISKMINREEIVETLLNGRGIPAEIPVQTESWLYEMGFAASLYDPESAGAILQGAGYGFDGGGYYRISNGNKYRLDLGLLVDKDNSDQVAVAEYIARTLNANGFEVTMEAVANDVMVQRMREGSFDISLIDYRVNPVPDFSILYSRPYFTQDFSMNVAQYQSDEVDRLIRELYLEHDELGRQNIFADIASILRSDCPYVGLYFKASSLVLRNDVRGVHLPNVWNPFGSIENWYIADYR